MALLLALLFVWLLFVWLLFIWVLFVWLLLWPVCMSVWWAAPLQVLALAWLAGGKQVPGGGALQIAGPRAGRRLATCR